jgi:hypothetical protein
VPNDDEIIKAANKFFGSVGSAIKKGAQSAVKAGQTVTGVGRGSVRVVVDPAKATPGGDVRGKVILDLNEPVDAKKLLVELRASQRVFDARGGVRALATTTAAIYRFEHELGGARRYHKEELPFTLTVPKDTGGKPQAPEGRIGDVARAVSSIVQPTTGPIEWRVVATLVISFGRDLEHAVDIVVV